MAEDDNAQSRRIPKWVICIGVGIASYVAYKTLFKNKFIHEHQNKVLKEYDVKSVDQQTNIKPQIEEKEEKEEAQTNTIETQTDSNEVKETCNDQRYTRDTVRKHNSLENEIWLIIDNQVYNITSFVKDSLHPASNEFIQKYYGKDATEPFEATFHSNDAKKLLKTCKIGKLPESEETLRGPSLPRFGQDISYAPKLSQFKAKSPLSHISVHRIFIYPVKGCQGIAVRNCLLTSSGFVDDRIYAFCNKKTKTVINQLTYPQLAQINIAFIDGETNCNKGIKINNEVVPFVVDSTDKLLVEWKSSSTKIMVSDQGEAISKWITSFLNIPNEEFILVRIHEENYREMEEYFALTFAPKSKQKMSGFQNYCSVLMCSEESLIELNKRYKIRSDLSDEDEKEIDWDRFRMNLIIKGVPTAHYEDYMKHIKFVVKLNEDTETCTDMAEILWSRRRYFCAVPQVNQNNGIQTQQPLATARRYRNAITLNDRTALPGDDAVFFGSHYCVQHAGMIHVGQQVITEKAQFELGTLRTDRGKSYFGLTSRNIGSQFEIDYNSQYEDFKLIKKEIYNHDTMRFRFEMKRESQNHYNESLKESLKLGDHYLLKFKDNDNNLIIRAYTPVFDVYENINEEEKYEKHVHDMCFDLLVKIYPHGKMSQYLKNMKINDTIKCKQDYGKICYFEIGKIRFGDPRFTMFLPYTLNIKKINLISGGSGITPTYQIISNINLNKEHDDTQISLIYTNKTVKDILLKDKLEQIAKTNKNITIHFSITRPNENDMMPKNIDTGRISKTMCEKYLFPPNKDNQVVTLICAPYRMEQSVKEILSEIGYDDESVAAF